MELACALAMFCRFKPQFTGPCRRATISG